MIAVPLRIELVTAVSPDLLVPTCPVRSATPCTLNASTSVINIPKRSFRVVKFFMKKYTSLYSYAARTSWGNPHVRLAVYYLAVSN